MQQVALLYYLISITIGFSAIFSISIITIKTREPFFFRYLFFNTFYTLLMIAFFLSLYIEVNFPEIHTAYANRMKLFIFYMKSGLIYSLVCLVDDIFDIPRRKLIDSAVFSILFLGIVFRSASYFNLIPEESVHLLISLPLPRIIVDGSLVLSLLYLVALRLLRPQAITPDEFKKIITVVTLILSLFAPFLILETFFYIHWTFFIFSPLLYSIINVFFAVKLNSYFIGYYRVPDPRSRPPEDRGDTGLPAFARTFGFSKREEEVTACLLEGDTNKKIAAKLFISASTVKAHIYNIFKKAGVDTRHQLIYMVFRKK